jgi:hypothetical protein
MPKHKKRSSINRQRRRMEEPAHPITPNGFYLFLSPQISNARRRAEVELADEDQSLSLGVVYDDDEIVKHISYYFPSIRKHRIVTIGEYQRGHRKRLYITKDIIFRTRDEYLEEWKKRKKGMNFLPGKRARKFIHQKIVESEFGCLWGIPLE